VTQGHNIILSLNFGQVGMEGQIDPKPGQRLQKTSESLRKGIDYGGAVRIIEAITECSIRTGQRPIRRLSGIPAAARDQDGGQS
jgi:hypothetical protein